MKSTYPPIFFWLLSLSGLHAQVGDAVVTGKVWDAHGEPLAGITIFVHQTGDGQYTEADGSFMLEGLDPGPHSFSFSGIGYREHKVEDTLHAGKTHTMDVRLEQATHDLQEVSVYGKSESTLLEQKGFAVNALDMEDMQVRSIQVNDILDQSAGVRIRQSGGLGSRVEYNINGLDGNSIRIYIDGIPIDNFGASFSLSSIPSSIIKRIEVYKGVVPAEFGGDALGGAINIVTKKDARNTLGASYSYGSFNTHQAGVNGNFRDAKTGLTARGSLFYNYTDNSYDVWGDKVYVTDDRGKKEYISTPRFHDAYRSKGLKFDLGFTDVKWADQVFIGGLLSDMDKEIQHGATMEIVYGNRRVRQNTNMLQASYVKRDFLLEGLHMNFFGSWSRLKRNVVDTVPYIYDWRGARRMNPNTGDWYQWQSGAEAGQPSLNEDDETKYTGRLNLAYDFDPRNRLSFNMLATHFARSPYDPLLPAAEQALTDTRELLKVLPGLSFENQSFGGRLKTSLFFKFYYQDVSLSDPVVQGDTVVANPIARQSSNSGYGAAFSFELKPGIILLASAENTIRVPDSRELFGNATENVESSYRLNPERSLNFNFGADLGPLRLQRHALGLKVNAFFRDIRDRILPGVPDQLDDTFSYVNVSEVLSTGVDVEFTYSFADKLYLTSGLSLANPRFNTEFDANGSRYLYYKDRLRNEPYFTINNNLRYTMSDLLQRGSRVSAYYNMGYVHEFYRNWPSIGGANKDIIPTQLVHDLGIAYTFPNDKITLSLDARNIFNEQVFDNWALQKPGRAFYTKININIF